MNTDHQNHKEKNIMFIFPTYKQVKEYWTNFNDKFTKFIKDWQEDILKK